MNPSVIILGGGIGGLSAAHELVERGFRVTVLEQRDVTGGKARSIDVPGSAVPPNAPLPGEHGFRFFPSFYRHIIDTMSRTPVGGGRTAKDQLVFASRELLGRFGYPPILFPAHMPRTPAELAELIKLMFTNEHTGLTDGDFLFFAERLWLLMVACHERAVEQYENESWWTFMDADNRSPQFVHYFVEGVTRCLVAAKATVANVRAGGVVLTQLVYGSMSSAPSFDRLLNGPTSQVWIHPWHEYLKGRGVEFRFETTVTGIDCDTTQITGVRARGADGVEHVVTGDHYVCALPVEYTAPLLHNDMFAIDPSLAGILAIADDVYDMTGIQFFLEEDVSLVRGHMSLIDSPWALTGLSQAQFWSPVDFSKLGDGTVKGILSIDISDWDTPGLCFAGPDGKNLTARQCTKPQVAEDVWTQMRRSLTQADGSCPLPTAVPRYFIDPGMVFAPTPVSNDSRLFVNQVGSWKHRPEAGTGIPNFFLASDYVRTYTNLATMEAANEAARRAVNAILIAADSHEPPCELWELYRPIELWPFVEIDKLVWEAEKLKHKILG